MKNKFGTDYATLLSKLPRSILQYQLLIHVLDADHLLFLLSRKILLEMKNIQPFDFDINLMGAGPVIDQMYKFDSYYIYNTLSSSVPQFSSCPLLSKQNSSES